MTEKALLSPELKDKFKMNANFAVGKYIFKGETIDLTTATFDTVQNAVANGFDVVTAIKENKPAVKQP